MNENVASVTKNTGAPAQTLVSSDGWDAITALFTLHHCSTLEPLQRATSAGHSLSYPKMILIVLVLYLCPGFQCQTEDTELSEDVGFEEYMISDMDPNYVGFLLHFISENITMSSPI